MSNKVLIRMAWRTWKLNYILLLSIFASSVTYAGTLTIQDDRGKSLTISKEPRRIASISYFGADVALALGIKPIASTFMVEGRNPDFLSTCMASVPSLGQRATPNLELLSKAKPDLIIAIRRYTEPQAARLERIAPYLAFSLETFADSDRSILRVAEAMGLKAAAERLNADFARKLAEYGKKTAKESRQKYLFIWGGGKAPWAFYNEHMTSSILNALGGINVVGSNPRPDVPDNTAFEMSLEAMLIADPDIIFVYDYGAERPFESNPIWSQLKAVKNKKVIFVKDHWVESHGPLARQILLEEAGHLLYPNLFPKPDVLKIAKRILSDCGR